MSPPSHPTPRHSPSIPHTPLLPPSTRLCFEEDQTFLAVSGGWTKKLPNQFFHFVFVLLKRRKCRRKLFSCCDCCASAHMFWLTLPSFFTLPLEVVFWVKCWCAKGNMLPCIYSLCDCGFLFDLEIQLFSCLILLYLLLPWRQVIQLKLKWLDPLKKWTNSRVFHRNKHWQQVNILYLFHNKNNKLFTKFDKDVLPKYWVKTKQGIIRPLVIGNHLKKVFRGLIISPQLYSSCLSDQPTDFFSLSRSFTKPGTPFLWLFLYFSVDECLFL